MSGKNVRWFAILVAVLVVFLGAALICVVVLRIRHQPVTPFGSSRAVPMVGKDALQTASSPMTPQTPSAYELDPNRQIVRIPPPKNRSAASFPTQTSPALPTPGTPRPLTPDNPIGPGNSIAAEIGTPQVDDSSPAPAPTHSETPAPETTVERHTVTLAIGTPINVSLWETISTERIKRGAYFRAILSSPIVRDGVTIAQAGSSVTGQVVQAKRTGVFGKGPELQLRLCDIRTTDNQLVAIRTYLWDEKGRSHKAVAEPFRSAFDALAARNPGQVVLPPNTNLQFKLAYPVSITEHTR